MVRFGAPKRTEVLRDHYQFNTVFDDSKARYVPDFEYTISFPEGVERTIDWLVNNDGIDAWDSENDEEIVAVWRTVADAFQEQVSDEYEGLFHWHHGSHHGYPRNSTDRRFDGRGR